MREWPQHRLNSEAIARILLLDGLDLTPLSTMEWWTWDTEPLPTFLFWSQN